MACVCSSLQLLLENPTNPRDPLNTSFSDLGLYLSADPDKLQDFIYLEETIMAIFPPSLTDLAVNQLLEALQMSDSVETVDCFKPLDYLFNFNVILKQHTSQFRQRLLTQGVPQNQLDRKIDEQIIKTPVQFQMIVD